MDTGGLPLNIPLLLAALFLGLCCLFPYNSFLSSPTYLEHYFQYAAEKSADNVSTLPKAEHQSFWNNVSNWATVTMLVPMSLFQFVMMTSFMLRLNLQIRMIIGASFLFVAMLLMPVCASFGGVSENSSMAVILIACILTGGATSLLQSSGYALFGTMPAIYVTLYILGGGVSGTVNSTLRIIIHYACPTTFSGIKRGAWAFYAINCVLMALVCVTVVMLRFNALVQRFCVGYSLEYGVLTDLERAAADSARIEKEAKENGTDGKSGEEGKDGEENSHEPAADEAAGAENEGDSSPIAVGQKIWLMMACVFLCMFTSLTYFPGIGLHAMHVDKDAGEDYDDMEEDTKFVEESVTPMLIILMFNAGDTVGRSIPNFPMLWMPKIAIVFLVLFRIVACGIPLILGVVNSKVINSNVNPFLVFAFLGLTNGYLVGTTFAYGCTDPRLKTESEHATAGTCMAFALLLGCSLGSVVAVVIVMTVLDD